MIQNPTTAMLRRRSAFDYFGRRPTLIFALLLCVSGCTGSQRDEDFIPDEDKARRALETYFASWQRQEPAANTSKGVACCDTLRTGGRALENYAILGLIPSEAPRCFAVRLSLANPSEEIRERYVVLGLDPLWVMRYPDYEVVMHWCPPEPKTNNGVAQ
jgi:hypothetical protein